MRGFIKVIVTTSLLVENLEKLFSTWPKNVGLPLHLVRKTRGGIVRSRFMTSVVSLTSLSDSPTHTLWRENSKFYGSFMATLPNKTLYFAPECIVKALTNFFLLDFFAGGGDWTSTLLMSQIDIFYAFLLYYFLVCAHGLTNKYIPN